MIIGGIDSALNRQGHMGLMMGVDTGNGWQMEK